MSGQKDKRVLFGAVPARAVSSLLWDNPANPHHCAGTIVRGLSECLAGKVSDPVAQQHIDLIVGDPNAVDRVWFKDASFKDTLLDYLSGAGSAMNPWPQENAHFYESDLEAMSSDWDATVSDMYTVLKAADFVKNSKYGQLKHDQPIGRREREAESGNLERDRFKATT